MSKNTEVMEFDEPAEIGVKIGTKNYILHEADSDTVTHHQAEALHLSDVLEKDKSVDNTKAMLSLVHTLLSKCFYKVSEGNKELASLATVKSLGNKTVQKLFERLKEISGMNAEPELKTLEKTYADLGEQIAKIKEAREQVKNSQDETTGG